MLTKGPELRAARDPIQALIPEARERSRRRRRRAVAIVVGLAMVGAAAAAATGWIGGGPVTGGPRPNAPGQLARAAQVSGFIGACDPLSFSAGSPPPTQGGVVEVLRGRVRSGPVIAGAREFVLPAGPVVATERIGIGQRFSFQLRPGRYALLARFAQGGHLLLAYHRGGRIIVPPYRQTGPAAQFLNVTIKSGRNPVEGIPSGCL